MGDAIYGSPGLDTPPIEFLSEPASTFPVTAILYWGCRGRRKLHARRDRARRQRRRAGNSLARTRAGTRTRNRWIRPRHISIVSFHVPSSDARPFTEFLGVTRRRRNRPEARWRPWWRWWIIILLPIVAVARSWKGSGGWRREILLCLLVHLLLFVAG